MHSERVTVSLPSDVLAGARRAVAEGAAPSVSAYVADALRVRQTKAEALSALEQALGGRPSDEDLDTVRHRWGLPARSSA